MELKLSGHAIMNETVVPPATPSSKNYFSDRQLIEFAKRVGTPLPFSLSSLQKDRGSGCLGGVPFRRVGGKVIYVPTDVFNFLNGLEIVRPRTTIVVQKRGSSSKRERVEAASRGITVRELRAKGGQDAA